MDESQEIKGDNKRDDIKFESSWQDMNVSVHSSECSHNPAMLHEPEKLLDLIKLNAKCTGTPSEY